MPSNHAPKESDPVLLVEWIDLPIQVTEWIFGETSHVFEGSPSLSVVKRLLRIVNELAKIAVSVFSQCSNQLKPINNQNLNDIVTTYLPIISALSLIFGTP